MTGQPMQCTLLIPDLFWPGETADAIAGDVDVPATRGLLARAQAEEHPPLPVEGWLCQAFEVERQQDWPVAPLTLSLDGVEPGEAYWLRADPVHLEVGRDRIVLVESALIDLGNAEAQALVGALDAQFADRGIAFHAPTPTRWYARLAQPPRLVTHSASQVAGRDVNEHLPAGEDALAWHTLVNEMQMLLHAHPVNAAREAAGAASVNSVWPWGGGTRPPVPGRHFGSVSSDDALAIALATAAAVHAQALPPDAHAWRERAAHAGVESHLVVLSAPGNAVRYRDGDAWRERLAALEAAWVAPLAEALRSRALARLTIVAPCAARCWRFEARRGDLVRFWRRARPWSSYA